MGSHWRNFLVKYSESNRMHKKMQALSLLCRRPGDPGAARRAIGRAQCNDAYWPGVFGGLYLPHLREAIWRSLALAERELRRGEDLAAEVIDLDGDGHEEIWIHSDQFSALVSPTRGGAIEEFTVFAAGTNYANTLTRRREPYHETALDHPAEAEYQPGGDRLRLPWLRRPRRTGEAADVWTGWCGGGDAVRTRPRPDQTRRIGHHSVAGCPRWRISGAGSGQRAGGRLGSAQPLRPEPESPAIAAEASTTITVRRRMRRPTGAS